MPNIPNQYHVQGGGISVSYYPDGFGPPAQNRGRLIFIYQDAHWSQWFDSTGVRAAKVNELGTVVSVTLVESMDTGSTTFSLLVPDMQLPEQHTSVFIHTEGITTVHRVFAGLVGHPQSQTYTVTALDGTAAFGPLPE